METGLKTLPLGAVLPGKARLRGPFAELPYERPAARLGDLDAARGIAILLVVLGHLWRGDPEGNAWYSILKAEIYLFHMALFMALAGVTFALSLPRLAAWAEVALYSARRLERLLLPYFVLGLLVIGGKLVAARYVHVDNLPGDSALLALLVMPRQSGTEFIWFIYVLSIYLALVPAFFRLAGRRPGLLLALAIGLYLLRPLPEQFMLDDAARFLPFFAGGMVLWQHREAWRPMGTGLLWLASAVFAAVLGLGLIFHVPEWLAGTASILPVLGWAQRLPPRAREALEALGRASFAIYLLNTIAIGLVKALMMKVLPWDGPNFLLYFAALTLAGVLGPLAARQLAQRYAPRAARYLA